MFCPHVPKNIIVPLPKQTAITGLNDYRPVTLTPIIMKCLERLVLKYIKVALPPLCLPINMHTEPTDQQMMPSPLPYRLYCSKSQVQGKAYLWATVVGLINRGDKTAYREEILRLTELNCNEKTCFANVMSFCCFNMHGCVVASKAFQGRDSFTLMSDIGHFEYYALLC